MRSCGLFVVHLYYCFLPTSAWLATGSWCGVIVAVPRTDPLVHLDRKMATHTEADWIADADAASI